MFIQTEETPNAETLKFIPGRVLLPQGETYSFLSKEESSNSPLALALFDISGVRAVFIGHDFITITKIQELDWYTLKPVILGRLMEYFLSNESVIKDQSKSKSPVYDNEDEISKQIREIIDTRVRPAVAQDGGDIVFHSFENGIVYVTMHGACSGCPSSSATLKSGIENMLKYYVPEVQEVQTFSE